MCSELIKNLGFNFNKHLSFNSANLKDNTYTTLQNFNKITETATQKSIMKELTEEVDEQGIPTKGDPFNFFATLIKLPCSPGTYASRELMYKIGEAGEEN
jgi:hypothetical protein